MNSSNRRSSRLIELPKLALLAFLLSGLVLCQAGPPIPPPVSTHTLSFWPLETPPWESSTGLPARTFTNLNLAPSWDYEGTALSVDTNAPAFLQLYVFQDGKTNISLASGSLEVWCQPNWTSVADGGAGPGAWATIWDIGQYTPDASAGAWLLAVDPSGSNLVWLAQSGGSNLFLWTPIDFDAGDWHQVVTTWSSSNAYLYVDGALATNAGPFLYGPGTLECSNDGFCVGSLTASGTNAGTNQFQGQLQWLVSYAQPLTAEEVSNSYAQVADYITYFGYNAPGGGGFHPDSGPPGPGGGWGTNFGGTNGGGGAEVESFTPPASISATNYAAYNQFYLTITNDPTNAYVYVCNTLSNLTYIVLTNRDMSNTNGWSPWEVLLASNSLTPAPAISLASNTLFFEAALVGSTGTNGLPDWWQMKYFGQLNVDPYADPDSDGLCNLDEYMLGTNPTNAYSVSSLHKDAQALFLAFTNYDSGCKYELFVTNGSDTNTVLATMSPTLVGTNYQIYSHNESDTNDTWIVETNFIGTNSVTTVAVALNGRTLDFVGGYGEDSDGDGLPDGYEVLATWTDPLLPDTGLTGTPDGYKDPDGDGYSNLQEMYNGTNPHVFDTPYGPINLVADISDDGNTITFAWQPASGPVLDYVISAFNDATQNWDTIATVSPTSQNYVLSDASDYMYGGLGYTNVQFTVAAIYAQGASTAQFGQNSSLSVITQTALAHGPGGKTYALVSLSNTNVTGFFGISSEIGVNYPEVNEYEQGHTLYLSSWSSSGDGAFSNIYIPASEFTNGVAVLNDSQAMPFVKLGWDSLTPILTGGAASGSFFTTGGGFVNMPFIDGTTQLKQNIAFLLEAATPSQGFTFSFSDSAVQYPDNYVYSTFYYYSDFFGQETIDHFAPFQDNYFFRNFAFPTSSLDANGTADNGWNSWFFGWGYEPLPTNTAYQFPTYDYVLYSNQIPVPGLLPSNVLQNVGFFPSDYLGDFGVYSSNGLWNMPNSVDIYGLPYESLQVVTSSNIESLSPGTPIANTGPFYVTPTPPILRTEDYYFARLNIDPMPGEGDFSVTNTTQPAILASVGNPLIIAGYAKQAVLNGYTNVFAYLGQYFSNALVMSNGTITTNPAGILSEYGEFFPTVPGEVALQTMPDPDQGNTNGTCIVDIVRLSLDVNHDGIMDETFTGPDNTSWSAPYTFWVNNDYDRWTSDSILLGGTVYEDDLESAAQPDYNFTDNSGKRAIPCPRDLEDYARLWVSGVSNVLSRLPSGSTVTLNWGDVGSPDDNGNNPTIDIFQAADPDGGVGYLTNLTIASNQINNSQCQYIGRLGPGSNMVLNSSSFSNGWAGDHYIWCGVLSGTGTLYLTVSDGSGNVLAQSSQTIQTQDIKSMYERWTVNDNDKNAPMIEVAPRTNAILIDDGQANGPTGQSGYAYDKAYDSNSPYILYVHGWYESSWKKDNTAETAYKRLYWQGYQGRFGVFHWPCYSLNIANLPIFDMSEWQAWKSGQGLKSFLTRLNNMYPSNVYLYAHSQGNVVSGEALRLATNRLVNTYVASQAAVSARAYDNTLASNAAPHYSNLPDYTFGTPDSEGYYYTTGANSYFNGSLGAGAYIDFYNPQDWALMGDKFTHPGWLKDQSSKPDGFAGYNYAVPSGTLPFGYYYQHPGVNWQLHQPTANWPEIALQFPGDTYQIFAMCAQSYSLALGTQVDVSDKFTAADQVDLSAEPCNFGNTLPYHDGQFTFDNMTTAPYWSKALQSYGLKK